MSRNEGFAPKANATDTNSLEEQLLTIYRLPDATSYPRIVPANVDRFWIDITTGGWARRCLPLLIANQAGWHLLNEDPFEVRWTGNNDLNCLDFRFPKRRTSRSPLNMVGYGIISWTPPLLFRTPPGINLWVRGPANCPKHGITPLEGIVETDWLPYPFTINWKITKRRERIRFEQDEPICLITPVRRYEVDHFKPVIRNLDSDQELAADYRVWHDRRVRAVATAGLDGSGGKAAIAGQGQYIRGEKVAGSRFEHHQTKLTVRVPVDLEPTPELSAVPDDRPRHRNRMLQRLFGR
jgi:hypothetical protein